MRGRKPNPAPGTHTSEAPSPPNWLTGAALEEWERVVPLLVEGGAVRQVDRAVLAAYCQTYTLWCECARSLTAADVVGEDGKLNPLARFTESSLKQLRGLLDQLGFTPAARKQILTGRAPAATIEDVLKGGL